MSDPVPLLGLSRRNRDEKSGWERFLDKLLHRAPQAVQPLPRPPARVMASRTLGASQEESSLDARRAKNSTRARGRAS